MRLRAHSPPLAILSFLFLAVAFADRAAAIVTYVQSSSQSGRAIRTSSIANFTTVQTAGNLNVVFIGWQGAASNLVSVVDSMGNPYTRVLSTSYGTATQVVYYAGNIAGAPAGRNSVSATFNAKVANPDLRIIEYGGIDSTQPLDAAGGLGAFGALTSSGPVGTSNPNDLLVASNFSQQSVTAAGAGYTFRFKDQYAQIVEDAIVAAAGEYAATAPQTKSGWFVMQLVALRVAAAAALVVPNLVGQTQTVATSALTTLGLAPGTTTLASSVTVPAGSVIGESPGAGASVPAGSKINLIISSGPSSFASSPYPASSILAFISWDETSKQRYAAGSDIWDSMWASDGLIYGVWGDGNGFSAPVKRQIGVSKLIGSPAMGTLVGADVYLGSPTPRVSPCGQKPTIGGKPRGVIALPNAVMYMFHSTYDLCTSYASLARSLDNGVTWTDIVGGGIWPDASGFAPVAVLQYGPGQRGALIPDSTYVPYLYIYGSRTNNAGSQYLARVPAFPNNAIETTANWSYYGGADVSGNPLWSASSAQAMPVWKDANYAESIAVTFNPALGRYIAYNDHGNACGGSPCERQVSLFDSPSPFGPWTTFDYEEQFDNTSCGNNCLGSQEAVGWAMMQKWFSRDGLSLWVQYSSTNAYDSLNFIKGTIGLASGSTVTNLTVNTGAAAVVDRLSLSDPGNIEFIDGPARLTSIPPSYIGTEVIRLARNDAPIADQNYLSFTSTVGQKICVAWNSVIAPPAWLAGWTNTGQSLVGDVTFNLYSMPVSAGTVTLPGPGSADAYLVLVGCH